MRPTCATCLKTMARVMFATNRFGRPERNCLQCTKYAQPKTVALDAGVTK